MAWTVEQARIYLGLPVGPGPEDVLIQQVLDETQTAVEGVLARALFLARVVERFYLVTSDKLLLPRFPIKTVHAIDYQGVDPPGSSFGDGVDNLLIHKSTGWIESRQFRGQRQIDVDYEGGWETLPLDLEQDMWSAFLTRYDEKDPTTGAPPRAGGSTVVAGSGEVSSVTIPDMGTIKYDVAAQTSTAATEAEALEKYGWLAPWSNTWDRYRAGQAGAGLGIV